MNDFEYRLLTKAINSSIHLSSEEKRSFVSLAHESSDSNQYKRTISRANAINLLNHLQRNQVQTYKYYQLKVRAKHYHGSMMWALGCIGQACRDLDIPPLQTVVINQGTARPGDGCLFSDLEDKDLSELQKQCLEFNYDYKSILKHVIETIY
jgi:hypothetical protein